LFVGRDANRGYGVSRRDLLRFGIAIELTNESRAILGGALGEIIDEGFDHVSAGLAKRGSSAVVGGISLHELRIELILAN
jgi:hypothetical protein